MKEAKSVIFSNTKVAPYTIEGRDLDKIAKIIMGIFKFTFNYWNRASIEQSAEKELTALKQALERSLGSYKLKLQNLDSLKKEVINNLVSFYLYHKSQSNILTIDHNELKQHILSCINKNQGNGLCYLPA